MSSGKNNEIDDESYLKQEVEIDAIAFAHKMMLEHFGLRTIVPSSIRDKVAYQLKEVI